MKHTIKAVVLGRSLLFTNGSDAYAQDLVKDLETSTKGELVTSISFAMQHYRFLKIITMMGQ